MRVLLVVSSKSLGSKSHSRHPLGCRPLACIWLPKLAFNQLLVITLVQSLAAQLLYSFLLHCAPTSMQTRSTRLSRHHFIFVYSIYSTSLPAPTQGAGEGADVQLRLIAATLGVLAIALLVGSGRGGPTPLRRPSSRRTLSRSLSPLRRMVRLA